MVSGRALCLGPAQQQRAEPLLDRGVVQVRLILVIVSMGRGSQWARTSSSRSMASVAADVIGQVRGDVRQQAPVAGGDALLAARARCSTSSACSSSSRTRSGRRTGPGSRCRRGRGRAGPSPTARCSPAGSVASTTSRWSGSPPSTSRRPSSSAARNDARTVRSASAIGGTRSRTAWVRSSWVSASEVHPSGSGSAVAGTSPGGGRRPAPGHRAAPAGRSRSGRRCRTAGSRPPGPRSSGWRRPARWGRGSATGCRPSAAPRRRRDSRRAPRR